MKNQCFDLQLAWKHRKNLRILGNSMFQEGLEILKENTPVNINIDKAGNKIIALATNLWKQADSQWMYCICLLYGKDVKVEWHEYDEQRIDFNCRVIISESDVREFN